MEFFVHGEKLIYRLQGLFLEVSLDERRIDDVFFQRTKNRDYSEGNRKRKSETIDLKVDLNYYIKSPYKMFETLVVFFKRYSTLDADSFNYRDVEEFVLDTTATRKEDIDYFAKQVMHYISYDLFGGIIEGESYLEIVKEDDIKQIFQGVDDEGFYIYGNDSFVKVFKNKIEEGIDLSESARNFVIWACVSYLDELLEPSEVIFRKNRMEIHVGRAKFLFRFADTREIHCTRSSQRCDKPAQYSPDLSVDNCIEFVDAVFRYVLDMTSDRTKNTKLGTF